jgi:hypothetical protein
MLLAEQDKGLQCSKQTTSNNPSGRGTQHTMKLKNEHLHVSFAISNLHNRQNRMGRICKRQNHHTEGKQNHHTEGMDGLLLYK